MDFVDSLGTDTARDVRALVDAATASDGVAPMSEHALHAIDRAGTARHTVVRAGDTVVGYAGYEPAQGDHPAMAEVVVHPAHRRRGHGRALVDAALSAGGDGARVWAHGDRAPARGLAHALGLVPARELLQMRRSLAEPALPQAKVPEDVVLRTYAGPEDDAEIVRVNAAAFAWHPEQGRMTADDIAEARAESWFDPGGFFLAFDRTDPSTLLGFHWTKVHPATETEPAIGEVYVVGIDVDAQGRGLGRVLTLAGLEHLRDQGLHEVLLYVEGDNTAALHTYDRLGFHRFHTDVAYHRP